MTPASDSSIWVWSAVSTATCKNGCSLISIRWSWASRPAPPVTSLLLLIADRKSDPDGFRRAAEDLNRRWLRNPNFDEFSLAQLILQSVALAGQYHIQYPGEIILMVKALITLEGVGNVLAPGINVAEAARKDVQGILLSQLNLVKFFKDSLLVLPDVLDILNRSPLVISEALQFLESQLKSPSENALCMGCAARSLPVSA